MRNNKRLYKVGAIVELSVSERNEIFDNDQSSSCECRHCEFAENRHKTYHLGPPSQHTICTFRQRNEKS